MVPRFKLLSLSATGRARKGRVFRLDEADFKDAIIEKRLVAKKPGKPFRGALQELFGR